MAHGIENVDATESATTADQTNLKDIFIPRYVSKPIKGGIILACYVATILMIVVVLIENNIINSLLYRTVVIALGVLMCLGLNQMLARRTRRGVRNELGCVSSGELGPPVTAAVQLAGAMTGDAAFREITKILVEQGRAGVTFRICPKESTVSIDPVRVTFEPLALDETESAFVGLDERATNSESDASTVQSKRRLNKYVRSKGGWFVLVLLGLFLGFELFQSIRRNRADFDLLMWGGLFLGYLLMPSLRPLLFTKQWFLVPSGIVLRRPKGIWKSGWNIRLFERRRCALCVYRYSPKRWWATVSDAEVRETIFGTQTEMHMLLRAWLSPLDPPPPDRLTDLE